MLHHDVGPVPDLALRSLDAPAQVDFLVVEKETLVEEPNPVEHATPDNAVGARHPVDLRRLKWIRPRTIYSSNQSRLRNRGVLRVFRRPSLPADWHSCVQLTDVVHPAVKTRPSSVGRYSDRARCQR